MCDQCCVRVPAVRDPFKRTISARSWRVTRSSWGILYVTANNHFYWYPCLCMWESGRLHGETIGSQGKIHLKMICISLREIIECLTLLLSLGSPAPDYPPFCHHANDYTGGISLFLKSARPFHISMLWCNLFWPPGTPIPTNFYQQIGPQTSRSKSTLRSLPSLLQFPQHPGHFSIRGHGIATAHLLVCLLHKTENIR